MKKLIIAIFICFVSSSVFADGILGNYLCKQTSDADGSILERIIKVYPNKMTSQYLDDSSARSSLQVNKNSKGYAGEYKIFENEYGILYVLVATENSNIIDAIYIQTSKSYPIQGRTFRGRCYKL